MPGCERNLILVHTPGLQARSDYESIKAKLATKAPDIEVFIVPNNIRNSVTRKQAATRPTLIFSPVPVAGFAPLRGRILAGVPRTSKVAEIRRLSAGGVAVPDTVLVEPDTALDPDSWGPFAVVKPEEGRQGEGIRLRRTRDVRWVDPRSWPRDDPRHGRRLVAQRFIDTGEHSTSFRVMTVLDRPVYSIQSRAMSPRPFVLDPAGNDPFDHPIASNGVERDLTLSAEPDVLACARDAARAFPEIPVLGIDIVRDATSARLYVLEVNPRGMTWHISSNYGVAHQRKYGLDLNGQFGALDVIADALIEATRREAT